MMMNVFLDYTFRVLLSTFVSKTVPVFCVYSYGCNLFITMICSHLLLLLSPKAIVSFSNSFCLCSICKVLLNRREAYGVENSVDREKHNELKF